MKKTQTFILALCLCLGLCACGGNSEPTIEPTYETTLEPTTELITQPVETTQITEPKIFYNSVIKDESVTTANSSTFIIAEADWAYKLSARLDSNSTLSMGEAAQGNILMYLKIKYTNMSSQAFDFNNYYDWNFAMLYDNTYTYSPDRINDTFTGYELQPLMTGDFYVVFQVPEKLKYDNKALEVTFSVDGIFYSFQIREESAADVMDTALNAGEKKVIDGRGEITLVKTTTTKKLTPPKASVWYTYFEAREGYTYVVAEFVVKNLGQDSIHTSNVIEGSVQVGDYPIEGMCILVSGDKSDLSANYGFEVLAEHTAYFIAEVPDDELDADISFSVIFGQEKFAFPFVK